MIKITVCEHAVDLTIRDCNLCKTNEKVSRLTKENERLREHSTSALDAINKVRCMLWSDAKSKRAYDKMTRSSEFAVCELQRALGLPVNED